MSQRLGNRSRAVTAAPELEALRIRLQVARLEGLTFAQAWPTATYGLGDVHLQRVLAATVDAWRRAYERRPRAGVDQVLAELRARRER